MAKQITAIDTATDTFSTWVARTNEIIAFCNTEVVSVNSTGTTATGDGYVNGHFGSNLFSTAILRGGNNTANGLLTIQTNTIISGTKLTVGASTTNVSINASSLNLANPAGSMGISVGEINFTDSLGTSVANIGVTGINFGYVTLSPTSLRIVDPLTSTNVNINTTAIAVGNTTITSPITVLTNGTTAQEIDSFTMASTRSAKYTFSIVDLSTSANAFQASELLVIHAGDTSFVTEYAVLTTNNSVGTLGVFTTTTNTTHVRLIFTPSVANTRVKGSKLLITV